MFNRPAVGKAVGDTSDLFLNGDQSIPFPANEHLTERLTDVAVKFINKNRSRPFFLFLSHTMPHEPLAVSKRFAGKSQGGLYGDVIEYIDWSTGQILDALRKNGLTKKTIVLFTSDNGPKKGHGSAAPLRGFKHQLYEGGVRVPCVVYAPGRIPAGRTINDITTIMDVYPTIAGLAGARVSAEQVLDGKDIWPLLSGKPDVEAPHNEFFYFVRHGVLAGVRQGQWKLLKQNGQIELYDLGADVEESRNLATQQPQTVKRLSARMRNFELEIEATKRPPGSLPHPLKNATSTLMLDLPDTGSDPSRINFAKMPRLPSEHAVINDVRDRGGKWVNQHAYLVHHAGHYWAMWSDGPGVPKASPQRHRDVVPGHDQPGTRVSYATSADGLNWIKARDLSGPPRLKGFGWIARGFWVRNGELLALASHFNAPGYTGKGLSLEAFRWDKAKNKWTAHGTVLDNALNNFPPKRLPSGEWMMSRRDDRKQVSVMLGGVKAFDQWNVRPLAKYIGKQMPEEPYWYILPDGKNIVGLLRDNSGSKRLLRTFSRNNGRNWTKIVRTNFPDAKSKFFVLRTSRGYYALVSNSNPRRRDPLTLAISRDGLVFHRLFHLVGGRHVDYPYMIEHDGNLLISFSSAKQTVEVLKVPLKVVDEWIAKGREKG